MPLWLFHHTKDAFSIEDKEKIAKGMANIYTTFGLPGFFAHCQFVELDQGSFWSGGKQPDHHSCTIGIYHAAASIRNPEEGEMFLKALDDVLRPVLRPKDIRWESNVHETPPDLWRLQGMAVPGFGTELFKKWVERDGFTAQEEEDLLRQQGYFDDSRWKLPTF
ncbi:hypothetical protein AYO21_12117 [Fonsecaea monophora]|uniref:Tautomerase cis-CaaD-like domain-containing protein n=1 Tax=Fonsecaea monophora TaxID=254056 RepID=A0A177EPC9_9EURO|nr:hypothetical protein AYO21_12117 [Fonsecaea monophora]OAG33787.1 hypothetical protein AYO21_12117 [Fonsecaea monophora]